MWSSQKFYQKLKAYLLPLVRELHGASIPNSATSTNDVYIKDDYMYAHYILQVNYTTYDMRRTYDTLHLNRNHCNVMVLADSDSPTRYWYARVLGVYHANVYYGGDGRQDWNPRRIDFLWVRWYETVNPGTYGWSAAALEKLSFPSEQGDYAFGFIHPRDVVRACHILPVFSEGKRFPDGLGSSGLAQNGDDWQGYYVGRWVW